MDVGTNRAVGTWANLGIVIVLGVLSWWFLRPRPTARSTPEASASTPASTEAAPPAEASARAEPVKAEATAEAVLEGLLQTKNRSDRSGAYLIPPGSNVPLLVALHGSGGTGAGLVSELRAIALRRKLAIVAPDSGFIAEAGMHTWYVARERGDPSADSPHIAACIEEALTLGAGRIAPTSWLVMGHSGGASSAPYLATHDARFSAFGVLHGGAFPNAFGPLHPRGWFSTGNADPARPPEHVSAQARDAERVLGPGAVEMHVFQGGHALLPDEIEGLIGFWLDRSAAPGRGP